MHTMIEELKRRRLADNLSTLGIARGCGVSEEKLKRWEQGLESPSLDELDRWAKVLDLKPTLVTKDGRRLVYVADDGNVTIDGSQSPSNNPPQHQLNHANVNH